MISERRTANSILTNKRLTENNRIQSIVSRNDSSESRERKRLKSISESVVNNNGLTSEIFRRHNRVEPFDTQNDTRGSIERKQVNTISNSLDDGDNERTNYKRSDRDDEREPVDSRNESHCHEKRIPQEKKSVFHRIFSFGLMIGLPFSPVLFRSKQKQKITKKLLKLWITGVTTAKTVFFVIECVYNHLFFPTLLAQYTFIVHCISGYVLMWIFLLKGRKIMASIRKILSLISFLNAELADDVADPMKMYFPLSIVSVEVMFTIHIYFFFFSEWEPQVEGVKHLIPFTEYSEYFYFSCSLAFFSAAFSFNIAMLTLYVALYATGAAYRYSGHLFTLYGKKLKKNVERGYFNAQTANESIRQFQYVLSCATEMDSTFNLIDFIIYANIYVVIFASFTLFLDIRFQTVEASLFGALLNKVGMDLLIYLCYSGDKFYEPLEKLKKELIAISGTLMKQPSIGTSTIVMFNLLSRQIKEANPCVTAWGIYDIKSRFIPHVLGALITYGVLLSRFGAYSSN